jgi:hypothetical protein
MSGHGCGVQKTGGGWALEFWKRLPYHGNLASASHCSGWPNSKTHPVSSQIVADGTSIDFWPSRSAVSLPRRRPIGDSIASFSTAPATHSLPLA